MLEKRDPDYDFLRTAGWLLAVALVAGWGCTGAIDAQQGQPGGSGGSPGGPGGRGGGETPINEPAAMPPAALVPAPANVRRLTAVEIANSVRDAFFADATPLQLGLADDVARHNFDNVFDGLDVTVPFGLQLATAAETVGARLVASLPTVLPCSKGVTAAGESDCLDELITKYGRRMFRGPVSAEQRAALRDLYAEVRPRGDFATAIRTVVEGMMHAPAFLFRTELGSAPGEKVSPLTSREIASALSYSLWRSGPDDALLDAAEDGLTTRNAILEQARRLMASPKARLAFRDFFWQWLEISDVARGVSKKDNAFSPALVTSILEESRMLIEDVVFGAAGRGRFEDILTTTRTFADKNVAQLYGAAGTRGSTFDPLALDAESRAGLLTTPAFIAAQTSAAGFSPIFPGVFVRRKMLCQVLPEPPPGIPPPSIDPNLTTREKFATHSNSPSCQECHKSIDDIGWAFERFDVLGRYHETERVGDRTVPLTAEGKLVGTDVDGSFVGAPGLAKRLVASRMVHDCFVGQLLEFMLGRDTGDADDRLPVDRSAIEAVSAGVADKDMLEIVAALTVTDSFLYRDARHVPGGL